MNIAKRLKVIVGLAIVFSALGVVGYSTYSRLMRKAEILERNLENKRQALGIAKDELSKAKQKNTLFAEEKESLNKEIALYKEQTAEIQQAQNYLQKQQEAFTAEKEGLEEALNDMKKLYQKQIEIDKLKEVSIEAFKKKVDSKMAEFVINKVVLKKQVKDVETKLKESAQKNQELLTKLDESSLKLDESRLMVIKLKLEKGEENNQLNPMSQEDEQFRKEALKFHYNAGFAYDQDQQFELALIEYEKALEAVPDDADAHYNLAILYDKYLVDKRKAIEHYHAYLRFCPDVQDAVKVNYWINEAKKELKWENR